MITGEKLTVKLNDNDNVATALNDIEIGAITQNVKSINKIPKGHKIALTKISKGVCPASPVRPHRATAPNAWRGKRFRCRHAYRDAAKCRAGGKPPNRAASRNRPRAARSGADAGWPPIPPHPSGAPPPKATAAARYRGFAPYHPRANPVSQPCPGAC